MNKKNNVRGSREWKGAELIGCWFLRFSLVLVLFILGFIIYDLASKGLGVINWEFITESPRVGMTEGGILPAIIGTFYVTLITVAFAVPLGVAAAIYLNEYAVQGRITRLVRMALRNLAGVPSIVFGLFGMAVFVKLFGFGPSLIAAGFTLGLLTLPVTVTAAEEALSTVPRSYREGSFALGATRWQMVRTVVLPRALPGILTGTILGLARAAGETAPILATGAAFFLPYLPGSIFSQFMALPYHLFIMSTQHHDIAAVRPIAYGTALVLVVLVFVLNLAAVILRRQFRSRVSRGL
ncbi:MAG TPA: phosphate ABC transporter permease PstA [Firmicutes bacterium]|nr:phosphate ABC transporter permease PstA [Bacillota bacterium]